MADLLDIVRKSPGLQLMMNMLKGRVPDPKANTEAVGNLVGPPAELWSGNKPLPEKLLRSGAAVADLAAPVKALLMGYSGDAEAAFRDGATSSISRNLIKALTEFKDEVMLNAARTTAEVPREFRAGKVADDLVLQALANKLSTKELSKYGTPDFVLDRFLRSTKERNGKEPWFVGKTDLPNILNHPNTETVKALNTVRAEYVKGDPKILDSKPVVGDHDVATGEEKSIDQLLNKIILENSSLIEDYTKSLKESKTLYHSENGRYAAREIADGFHEFLGKARELGIPEGDIAKKSFAQLDSIIKKKEDEALKELQRSAERKTETIVKRTNELAKGTEQNLVNAGWVRLSDEKDLAQETCAMNHCIGAVGRNQDGTYIPAYDTVTGAKNKGFNEESSFASYRDKMRDDTHEYYSYRPDGTPKVTVEVDKRSGRIIQAFSKEDSDLTREQVQQLHSLSSIKGFDDATGYLDNDFGNFTNEAQADAVWQLQHGDQLAQPPRAVNLNPALFDNEADRLAHEAEVNNALRIMDEYAAGLD